MEIQSAHSLNINVKEIRTYLHKKGMKPVKSSDGSGIGEGETMRPKPHYWAILLVQVTQDGVP